MIEIVLPWPNRALSPNARTHWAKRAKLVREAKDTAFYYALHHKLSAPFVGDVAIEYQFNPPSARRYDVDNALAACKAYQDGVCAAVGIDDSQLEPVVLRRGKPSKPGTVVIRLFFEKDTNRR